jgi:hypothetical protein
MVLTVNEPSISLQDIRFLHSIMVEFSLIQTCKFPSSCRGARSQISKLSLFEEFIQLVLLVLLQFTKMENRTNELIKNPKILKLRRKLIISQNKKLDIFLGFSPTVV